MLGAFGDGGSTGNGDAVRASIAAGHDHGRFSGVYESTTAGYSNPFGSLTTPGLTNYRIAYDHPTGLRGSVSLEYDGQTTTALGENASQQNLGLHLRQPLSKKLTLTAGADVHRSSGQTAAVPAPILGYSAIGIPTPSPDQPLVQNVSYAGGASTQADLGLNWRAEPALRARGATGAEHRRHREPDAAGANQRAVHLSHGRSGKLLRARAVDRRSDAELRNLVGRAHRPGAVHALDADRVRSLGQSDDDGRVELPRRPHGVRHRRLRALRRQGDVEVLANSSPATRSRRPATARGERHRAARLGGFGVYGADLSYANGDRFHATPRCRREPGFAGGSTLNVGAAGGSAPEISILANVNATNVAGYSSNTDRIGVAWRPSGDVRGAGLLAYQRTSGDASSSSAYTDVVSYDQLYRPTHRLDLVGRVAYELDGDAYYAPDTLLYALPRDAAAGRPFDIGAEFQWIGTSNLGAYDRTSFASRARDPARRQLASRGRLQLRRLGRPLAGGVTDAPGILRDGDERRRPHLRLGQIRATKRSARRRPGEPRSAAVAIAGGVVKAVVIPNRSPRSSSYQALSLGAYAATSPLHWHALRSRRTWRRSRRSASSRRVPSSCWPCGAFRSAPSGCGVPTSRRMRTSSTPRSWPRSLPSPGRSPQPRSRCSAMAVPRRFARAAAPISCARARPAR